MLIRFMVNNFKSIKDTLELSLVSGTNNKMENTRKIGNLEILPSAVIYGSNASGKTNVLEAFDMMRRIVLNHDKIIQSQDTLPYNPFKLSTETENSPTVFDVFFSIGEVKYKYGFEYDSNTIYAEWLSIYESNRPTTIFEYDIDNGYKPNNKIKEVQKLSKMNNSLYLWELDRKGYKYATDILSWFNNSSYVSSKKHSELSEEFSRELLKPSTKEFLSSLLKEADLGIEGIDSIDIRNGKLKIWTLRKKYDENGKEVGVSLFDFDEDESLGTQKFFELLEPITRSLKTGCPIFIDELDANLHPMLAKKILFSLFHNSEYNKKFAQLVFTTQDTIFLDLDLMHKSQIWFSEKDNFGATNITSLVEYKGVTTRMNLKKDYMMGKYGAVPYLGDFFTFFQGE